MHWSVCVGSSTPAGGKHGVDKNVNFYVDIGKLKLNVSSDYFISGGLGC
jgi:hypothetical protein